MHPGVHRSLHEEDGAVLCLPPYASACRIQGISHIGHVIVDRLWPSANVDRPVPGHQHRIRRDPRKRLMPLDRPAVPVEGRDLPIARTQIDGPAQHAQRG
jgi:hypothetical protein